MSTERRASNRNLARIGDGSESQAAPSLDQNWRERIEHNGGDEVVLGPVRGDYRGEMRP